MASVPVALVKRAPEINNRRNGAQNLSWELSAYSPVIDAQQISKQAVRLFHVIERTDFMKGVLIGALVVATGVLGYLYYKETENQASITIEAPRIETPSTN